MSDREWSDAHVLNAALDIHRDDPTFGYRFITDELHRQGIKVSENTVQRLCRQHHIWSVFAKKRGLSRKPGLPVHDDLIKRQFTAQAANRVWLPDVTEHPSHRRWTYIGGSGHFHRLGNLKRYLCETCLDRACLTGDFNPTIRHGVVIDPHVNLVDWVLPGLPLFEVYVPALDSTVEQREISRNSLNCHLLERRDRNAKVDARVVDNVQFVRTNMPDTGGTEQFGEIPARDRRCRFDVNNGVLAFREG